jgi:hypothetical protein
VMRDLALTNGLGECDENRVMGGRCGFVSEMHVATVEFLLPEVDECKRHLCIANLVAEIVGDAAVGVDAEEVLMEALGQEPGGNRKIFVMTSGKALAVCARLIERRRDFWDLVARWKARPGFAKIDRAGSLVDAGEIHIHLRIVEFTDCRIEKLDA